MIQINQPEIIKTTTGWSESRMWVPPNQTNTNKSINYLRSYLWIRGM